MESPVQAGYQSLWQIRVAMGIRDAERNKVVKRVSHVPRKAAIVLTCHDRQQMESLADEIIAMREGRIVNVDKNCHEEV